MTEQTLTIRQMCDLFDVTPRALRFYEAKELLFPIREGTRRLFTRGDRARLTLILRGKRFGFSLEEIRQLLDLWEGGKGRVGPARRPPCEVAQRHLDEMVARRERARRRHRASCKGQLDWGRAELDRDPKADAA